MDKLKIKKDEPFWVLNMPDNCTGLFTDNKLYSKVAATDVVKQVLFFAPDKQYLKKYIPRVIASLAPDALFWIAYPKKSSKLYKDLTRDHNWERVIDAGYHGVSVVSLNDEWSALRFRENDGQGVSVERGGPRVIEGVDYAAKTVVIPEDLKTELEANDLLSFFNKYSFSHRKEYVESVVTAKKAETRQSRINKVIELLQEKKQNK